MVHRLRARATKMTKRIKLGKYEGMFIINSRLAGDAPKNAIKKIASKIEQKGKVVNTFELGKRPFAYKIDNMSDGYYYLVQFEGPTSLVEDLRVAVQHEEDLVRYMVMRIEKDFNPTLDPTPIKIQA